MYIKSTCQKLIDHIFQCQQNKKEDNYITWDDKFYCPSQKITQEEWGHECWHGFLLHPHESPLILSYTHLAYQFAKNQGIYLNAKHSFPYLPQ